MTKVDPVAAPILGVAEVAEYTGLKPDTITKYRSLGKFPEPDYSTARQDLWRRSTIKKWMAKREVKRARP